MKIKSLTNFGSFFLTKIILFCLPVFVQAQDIACFKFISDSTGCIPLKVRVRSCALGSTTVAYNFLWKTNPNPGDYFTVPNSITDTSFIYDKPGTYIIEQLRGGTRKQQRVVQVFDSSARPTFRFEPCNDSLTIAFNDPVFKKFQILWGDQSNSKTIVEGKNFKVGFRYTFPTERETFKISVSGLEPITCNNRAVVNNITLYKKLPSTNLDSLFCSNAGDAKLFFKLSADLPYAIWRQNQSFGWEKIDTLLSAEDAPENVYENKINFPFQENKFKIEIFNYCPQSQESAPIRIQTLKAQGYNKRIEISWSKFDADSILEFRLFRNGNFVQNFPATEFAYTDTTNLACGLNYCYQIRAIQKSKSSESPFLNLISISDTSCKSATSSERPPKVKDINASVNGNAIQLWWKKPEDTRVESFKLLKSESNQNFIFVSTLVDTNYVDNQVNTQLKRYCYRIFYEDVCQNISDTSAPFCPVLLQVSQPRGFEKLITWTASEVWQSGVNQYLLEYLDASGNVYKTLILPNSLQFTDKKKDSVSQRIRYRIKAVPEDLSLGFSYSNVVEIIQEPRIAFPDVFTPNEDGINDEFRCYSRHLQQFKMNIFNRWGEKVFETESISLGWNGKLNGSEAPSGVYVYIAEGTDSEGRKIKTKGTFSLVR